jgi:hypothetical protein
MEEKLVKGLFGRCIFNQVVKDQKGVKHEYPRDIEGVMITDTDIHKIWLVGTDGAVYMAEKKRVKDFIPMNKKVV